MRNALTFGLLLLALTLLLNAEKAKPGTARSRSELARSTVSHGTTVRIFSSGATLIPERFERCVRAQEIMIDGDLLKTSTSKNGLRVASFFPGGREVQYRNYDLAKSDEDVAAFVDLVESAAVDTVLAMGVFRFVSPRGPGKEERLAILSEVFAELGTESKPETRERPSWAYLCLRRPEGWIPLAERLSETKGIMLAYNLTPDVDALARLPRPRPFVEDERVVRLADEFPSGQTLVDPWIQVRRGYGVSFEVNDSMEDGIMISPPYGPGAPPDPRPVHRLVFPYVRVGSRATLETDLGIESWHRQGCRGVEFEVVCDGEVVASRRIAVDPNEPDAWLPWSVDLSAFEHRWFRLELVVRGLGLLPSEVGLWHEPAIWGTPRLQYVPDDPAEEHSLRNVILDDLDSDHDGFLARDEATARLVEVLDADQNGKVEQAEEPVEFPGVVQAMDANRDGVVLPAEIRAFYDDLDAWLRRVD